jgi:peptide/nickel transport system permease protein
VRGYVARRVLYLIPTWIAITLLAFVLAKIAPGDPAVTVFQQLHGHPPSRAELVATRHRLGLDEPLPEQYADWLGRAVRGDLGTSYATGDDVRDELLSRAPATFELAGAATLLAVLIAVPLGVLAAVRRNSLVDQALRAAAMLAASIPSFWLAFLLITLFSVDLGLLPAAGRGGLAHLVLPAVALALGPAAVLTRLTRSAVLDALGEDFVRTARAKGVRQHAVLFHHALRNAAVPLLTVAGLALGHLLGGSLIVEWVFAWPGMGDLAINAIHDRDYPLIQGFVLFAGLVYVLVNFAIDVGYGWLDPRVRVGSRT